MSAGDPGGRHGLVDHLLVYLRVDPTGRKLAATAEEAADLLVAVRIVALERGQVVARQIADAIPRLRLLAQEARGRAGQDAGRPRGR